MDLGSSGFGVGYAGRCHIGAWSSWARRDAEVSLFEFGIEIVGLAALLFQLLVHGAEFSQFTRHAAIAVERFAVRHADA